jgi:aspartate aminotransferase
MKLSERAIATQESPIRKLKPLVDQVEAKGIKIYRLNIGQPDLETPKEIVKVYKKYHEKVLSYGPAQGLDLYRENLVNYYQRNNIDINKDDIIVTTAGSEAIIFALMTTCNPGDEIIIPEPFYTNYNGFAKMAGVKVVPLTTHAENGYGLPSDEKIKELINEKTKAILICSPNNPTGAVYPRKDMERIAKIAQEHDLFIISDEVYREFIYNGEEQVSFLNIKDIEDKVIMVDSISKRYSACGARIGCLISRNKGIMAAALKFAQARLCPPTIDQLAANAAIDIKPSYFKRVIKEYDKRRNIVFNALQEMEGVICEKPAGSFYIMAKLPIKDAESFIKWLLTDFEIDNETLVLAPGNGFYATPNAGRDKVRIAYVLNEKDLKKAMYILKKGLEEYKKINNN